MIALEPAKRATEVRGYQHDWSDWLGTDDTIASQTTTGSGVTVDSSSIDTGNLSTTFFLSGGTDGATATITQTIITAGGRTETEVFVLRIGDDEPVTLREAKMQCAMLEDDTQDEFIASLIPSARAYVERITRLSFVSRSMTAVFNRWGDYLEITRRPISTIDGVTYSVSDDPLDDVAYTGFAYNVNAFPVRVYPALGGAGFPEIEAGQTITVAYTTGALAVTDEEYLIGKRAILLLIGFWFENRGEVPLDKDTKFALDCVLDDLAPLSAY